MLLILFTLVVVLLSCVSGISSKQRIDVGHPVTKSLNASASVAISQASLNATSNDIEIPSYQQNEALPPPPGNGPGGQRLDYLLPTTPQSSQTATVPQLSNDTTSTPNSGSYSAMIGTKTASRKNTLTEDFITSSLGAKSTDLPPLIFGSQTIKTDGQNEYTRVHVHTPTSASTTTEGSDSSATFIASQILPTQSQLVVTSSSSKSSPIAPTSAVSRKTPLPTLKGQNITTTSPGQHNINGQTSTPGAEATISGTIISIAPKASDNGAAHSTNVPSTNTTIGSNSGPAGTSVQVFKGGVLGGRDGLWSSSIILLMGIAVLLWL